MCPAHSVSPFCFWIWQSLGHPTNFKRTELQERVLPINVIVRKGGTQKSNKCNHGLRLCLSFNSAFLAAVVRGGRVPWTSPYALLPCLHLLGGLFPTAARFGLQISQTSTFFWKLELSNCTQAANSSLCKLEHPQNDFKRRPKTLDYLAGDFTGKASPLRSFSSLRQQKEHTSHLVPLPRVQSGSACPCVFLPLLQHRLPRQCEECKSNNPPLHWCVERVTSPCQRVSPSWLPHRGCPFTHISNNHQEVQKQAEPWLMAEVTGGCHNWPRHNFHSWGGTG